MTYERKYKKHIIIGLNECDLLDVNSLEKKLKIKLAEEDYNIKFKFVLKSTKKDEWYGFRVINKINYSTLNLDLNKYKISNKACCLIQ